MIPYQKVSSHAKIVLFQVISGNLTTYFYNKSYKVNRIASSVIISNVVYLRKELIKAKCMIKSKIYQGLENQQK